MPKSQLSEQQISDIEDMIKRRMSNTGETREQACDHIRQYLLQRLDGLQ